MKTLAILQARMGSSRLPGKILSGIEGKPMLLRIWERVQQIQGLDQSLVATSAEPADDAVEEFCRSHGVPFFRGSMDDVLDRFYQAACEHRADNVLRLTADCPLLDPEVTSRVLEEFQNHSCDYASNTLHPSYPDGLDSEVFTFQALETAWKEAKKKSDREHVTSFIYHHPERFRLHSVKGENDLSALRWTVDEARDLDLVRKIYQHLDGRAFGFRDVLDLLAKNPHLGTLNQDIKRNEGYAKSLREDRMPDLKEGAGQKLYQKAKNRIPGGTQLLSKRPEMFLPDQWPAYFQKAKGAEAWDLDGNRYLDFSLSGIGSCLLGFADEEVNAAVKNAVDLGSMATLNCPEEVELADLLCEIHPWAGMVRFARSGGEVMSMAVRTARASTGRDMIAFCGYHGWHDWYLSANLGEDKSLDGHLLPGLQPKGVPRGLRSTALPFRYNCLADLEKIVAEHGASLAAIVTEPIRSDPPSPDFMAGIQRIAQETGAVLIVDEITMGFRLNEGGAHLQLGLEPDLAVFAKGMSNGFPMAALIGKSSIMQAAQETFMSSTYWTERIGPTAALATIRKIMRDHVPSQLCQTGREIREGWKEAARASGLEIKTGGVDALPNFAVQCENPMSARTFFTQEMLKRGYLAVPAVYVTKAHTREMVAEYLSAVKEVFVLLADAVKTKCIDARLDGPVAHSGFTRLT